MKFRKKITLLNIITDLSFYLDNSFSLNCTINLIILSIYIHAQKFINIISILLVFN